MAKWKYYAIYDEKKDLGKVFESWDDCAFAVKGVSGIKYKGFKTYEEALIFAHLKRTDPTKYFAGGKDSFLEQNKKKVIKSEVKSEIINPNQKKTQTVPKMSVDEYCANFGFNHLTKEQRQALAFTDGKALLYAVPGSGKTTLLMARMGYLVHSCGINPGKIVSLSFTKAAAEEMRKRYVNCFKNEGNLPMFRTIHSFCWSVIIKELKAAGMVFPSNLLGAEDEDDTDSKILTQRKVLSEVLRHFGLRSDGQLPTS